MKRILIIFGLVFCLGMSAPLAKAADSFNFNESLNINLANWLTDTGVRFFEFPGFSSPGYFDVLLVYDHDLARSGLAGFNYQLFTNGFTGFQSVLLNDLLDMYTAARSGNITADVSYYMLNGKDAVEYEWDGKNMAIPTGSLFVNITLYDNGVALSNHDLILTPTGTFTPTPIPAAALLLGSGLAGLAVLRRKMA